MHFHWRICINDSTVQKGDKMKKTITFMIIAIIVIVTYKATIYTANPDQPTMTEITRMLGLELAETKKKLNAITHLENIRGTEGETVLHYAAQYTPELIEFILTKNINVNVQDSHKRTPLMYAAGIGNAPGVKTLLERGADPLMKDKYNRTAFDITKSKIDQVKIDPRTKSFRKFLTDYQKQQINNYENINNMLQEYLKKKGS